MNDILFKFFFSISNPKFLLIYNLQHLSHNRLRILLLLTVYMHCHLDLSTILK